MSATDDVKRCPTCGALSAVLALERFDIRTFYCADCEYDWDERQERTAPEAPDAPGPQ